MTVYLKNRNVLSGILFSLFSLFFLFYSFSIKIEDIGISYLTSSRFFPQLICCILLLSSLSTLLSGIKQVKVDKDSEQYELKNFKRIIGVILIMALYIVLLSLLGFIISTIVFSFLMITLLSNIDDRRFTKDSLVSVGVTIVIFVIFAKLFGLGLPSGIF